MAQNYPLPQIYQSGAPDPPALDYGKILIIEGLARCRNCNRYMGTMDGRNLIAGEVIVVTRTPLRCRSCLCKNLFEPRHPEPKNN